jgi:serine/threonine protein kinase
VDPTRPANILLLCAPCEENRAVVDASRLGDYVLEEELGRGATGAVWRATSRDGRIVALKVFDPALALDQEYRARLAREARIAREIQDPHLVRMLDAGEEDDRLFLVLEYVGGGSLADRLANGPLGLDETVRVVSEVAAGLDTLHRGGIVHRDVKPSNVLLRENGSAALTDFGVAKGAAYTVLTRPGQVIGTLDYLAPELVRGGEATPASDVYALGCVAFECVAGRPPFGDRSLFGVGTAHLEDEPPEPPGPPGLAWALQRALQKDPAERPATATTYAHLLQAAAKR